jgi:hypothetical protein
MAKKILRINMTELKTTYENVPENGPVGPVAA